MKMRPRIEDKTRKYFWNNIFFFQLARANQKIEVEKPYISSWLNLSCSSIVNFKMYPMTVPTKYVFIFSFSIWEIWWISHFIWPIQMFSWKQRMFATIAMVAVCTVFSYIYLILMRKYCALQKLITWKLRKIQFFAEKKYCLWKNMIFRCNTIISIFLFIAIFFFFARRANINQKLLRK